MRNLLTFVILLFILAAIMRLDFFFTVVYLLLAVYLLSRLWMRRIAGDISIERQFERHAFPGDKVTVGVSIRDGGFLPVPWLEVNETLPIRLVTPPYHRQVVSLRPHESRRITYVVNCRQRGYHPIGPLRVRTGDLFGIEGHELAQLLPDHLIVYPRIVPLHRLGLPARAPLAALAARAPLYEDPAHIMGIRDYRAGDSPRRIHWTASAATGRLQVKRYQPSIARETLICLDLDEESYDLKTLIGATELAITAAASIANHIVVHEKLPVGLATVAHDPLTGERTKFFLPPRRERAHLMSVLEVLARAQTTERAPLPQVLRTASLRLSWGSTIAVITGRETASLFDAMASLRRSGFAVSLILVQPGRPSAEVQKRSQLLSIPVHRVWNDRDLEMWQHLHPPAGAV